MRTKGSAIAVNHPNAPLNAIVQEDSNLYYQITSGITLDYSTSRIVPNDAKVPTLLTFPLSLCVGRIIALAMTIKYRLQQTAQDDEKLQPSLWRRSPSASRSTMSEDHQ